MHEAKTRMAKPEEELVDVLLDFIIVSATLAQKIIYGIRDGQSKEGVNRDVKDERAGCRNQRLADCGGCRK